jgi:glycosyltransferase involved in cell wall biosynthesis
MAGLKLSIALCTYNGAKYLREQLDSIGHQTRLPDELVICDDGSTDSTPDIVLQFASSTDFPVTFTINEVNLGITKNFEKAIGRCTGDIILLSDQDDIWRDKKLQAIEDMFLNNPGVMAVFSDAEIADESLRPMGYRLWRSMGLDGRELMLAKKCKCFDILIKHNIVTGMTLAFRASCRDTVLPIPPFWLHDAWIGLLTAATGGLATIDEPLVIYRQHAKQQIGAPKNEIRLIHIGNEIMRLVSGSYRVDNQKYLDHELKYYSIAYEILSGRNYDRVILDDLQAKVAHLRIRVDMPNRKRLARIPIIFGELINGHYSRYSVGRFNFIKDFI